jgi:hypothetical protein
VGLNADKIQMQNLVAAGAGAANGGWIDLSGFRSGAFWLIVASIGAGSITPAFQMSPDAGLSSLALPSAELAAPTAISAPGVTRYPFIGNMQQAWARVVSTIVTGPVTASIYFIGHT